MVLLPTNTWHIPSQWLLSNRCGKAPAVCRHYFDAPPGIPFALEQNWSDAVAKVHTNKSVAQPFLPGVVWRSAPWEVASFVYLSLLQDWWSQSRPQSFPKIGRTLGYFSSPNRENPIHIPNQLRPISLMEPLGKIVMGLITTKIKACIFPPVESITTVWIFAVPCCN